MGDIWDMGEPNSRSDHHFDSIYFIEANNLLAIYKYLFFLTIDDANKAICDFWSFFK